MMAQDTDRKDCNELPPYPAELTKIWVRIDVQGVVLLMDHHLIHIEVNYWIIIDGLADEPLQLQ